MMIFGPLVRPVTSTVTLALSRPVAVTFSPSTTITTGRVRVSPAAAIASISMTSPTATFCCLLPLRTIAYTASHSPRSGLLVNSAELWGLRATPPMVRRGTAAGRARRCRCVSHRGSRLRDRAGAPQNDASPTRSPPGLALARALLLDRYVLHRGRLRRRHGARVARLDPHRARLDRARLRK